MQHRPKILVVDDDDGQRVTLVEILEDEGCDVTAVSTGLKAVEMATKNHFDLIFMDYKMPGIDGEEAYRQIKAVRPEISIIMQTAYEDGLIKRSLDEGVYAILNKPYELNQVTELVRSVLKSTCVLVADDEPDMRALLRAILEDRGFQVSEAEDRIDAVTKARERHYDVILMDVVMPVMDGFAACEKIVEEDPDAKVIFLTGHSVKGWIKQALSIGAFFLLEKPVEPDDMLSLVKSVVEADAPQLTVGNDQPG